MSRIIQGGKEALYKLDFFYESNFLRYKDQGEHNTLTGGVVSLGIILLIFISFAERLSQTFDKINIQQIQSTARDKNPTPYEIKGKYQNFMFGVEIFGIDFNETDDVRYFDIILQHNLYNRGQKNINLSKQIYLQPCTLQHWRQFPDILNEATQLGYSSWLCLPLNASFEIKGKELSKQFRNLQISIRKCSNSSGSAIPCASQTQFSDIFPDVITSIIYFINANLNPGQTSYIQYYLQSSNSITFSTSLGSKSIIQVEEFEIQTDQSIIPYPIVKKQSGVIMNHKQLLYEDITEQQQEIASFQFRKSVSSRKIRRSFNKLDDTFSYLGGLISIISMALIVFKFYNAYNYQVSIGSRIFKSQNQERMGTWERYNFLDFIGHLVYSWCQTFGFDPNWTRFRSFYKVQSQICAQLDAKFLVQRLIFIDRALDTILDECQLKGIHLFDKLTVQESKKMRRKYYYKNRLVQKIKNKKQKLIKKQDSTDLKIQNAPDYIENINIIDSSALRNSHNLINRKPKLFKMIQIYKNLMCLRMNLMNIQAIYQKKKTKLKRIIQTRRKI